MSVQPESSDAVVRALVDVARRLESQGHLHGALENVRAAQAMAAPGGTLAQVLESMVASLEERQRAAETLAQPQPPTTHGPTSTKSPTIHTSTDPYPEEGGLPSPQSGAQSAPPSEPLPQQEVAQPYQPTTYSTQNNRSYENATGGRSIAYIIVGLLLILILGGVVIYFLIGSGGTPIPTRTSSEEVTPSPTKEVSNFRTLSGHLFRVSSVAFSPDGQTLASGSGDETIKLWRVK